MRTAAVAALLILAAVTSFWFVTSSGPFAVIEPSQWALDLTEVSDVHALGYSGSGVTVCVVDSGVDLSHPELIGVNLVAWKDFVNDRTSAYDDFGHGTAMAGIIFAGGRLPGIAKSAALIAVKAISSSGSGTDLDVANAIRFCVDPNADGDLGDGAHVISLSLGGNARPFLGSATEDAANAAMDRGVIVVAAAGNDGEDDDGDVESPASVPRVVAVGAVNRQGVLATWSSRGQNLFTFDPDKKPEVVAPGVSIATILPDGAYAYVSGTSPAAAFVAGIVALLLGEHPAYRHASALLTDLKFALMRGACGCSGSPVLHDDRYGYGIVQALATDALL